MSDVKRWTADEVLNQSRAFRNEGPWIFAPDHDRVVAEKDENNLGLLRQIQFRDQELAEQAKVIERLWLILDSEMRVSAQDQKQLEAKRADYRRQVAELAALTKQPEPKEGV